MKPRRKYKPRYSRTPGETLLQFLVKRGGHATLWQIARATPTGRLLREAAPELGDLITVEKHHDRRSRHAVTSVFLTLKGYAAAALTNPSWQPRRLATPILKSWLEELAAEDDPWAIEMIRDHDDALQWRSHELKIERKQLVCGTPKPKARPRGRPYVGQGIHGPSTKDLPPKPGPKAKPANHLVFGGGFSSPLPASPMRPAPATPTPEPKREEAVDARKAELKRHCVICSTGGIEIEHDCSRFQVA